MLYFVIVEFMLSTTIAVIALMFNDGMKKSIFCKPVIDPYESLVDADTSLLVGTKQDSYNVFHQDDEDVHFPFFSSLFLVVQFVHYPTRAQ